MKKLLCVLLTACCLSLLCLQSGWAQGTSIVPPGARVAIIGDSITEQKQYSRFIELYLMACMPQLNTHVMQFGWSGERAGGCNGRMANDILPFKPTIATLCYGMNDGSYTAYTPEIGKNFESPMRSIVNRFKEAGTTVVVGSPGAVDSQYFSRPDGTKAAVYNPNLAQLRDIAKTIATDSQMPFANVHDALYSAMVNAKAAYGDQYDVCGTDGVHPRPNGHLVMAYAFLKGMGFDGDLGTITIDMTGKATAENGHKVLAVNGNQVEIESTRYPFCMYGAEKDSNGTRSILPFVPFNQELNRLTLIVKNSKSAQVKVTWGTASKVFPRAELEKGINLAAEFPDNPFSEPFKQVEAVVATKQSFETVMIKNFINLTPNLQRQFIDDTEATSLLNGLCTKLWVREDALHTAVRNAVVPVKHTITVEAVNP